VWKREDRTPPKPLAEMTEEEKLVQQFLRSAGVPRTPRRGPETREAPPETQEGRGPEPSTQLAAKAMSWKSKVFLAAGLVAVLGLFAGTALQNSPPRPTEGRPRQTHPTSPPPQAAEPARTKPLDAGAWMACRTFDPLVRDVDRGTLSQEEWRAGLKEVYDHAKVYPNSDVARASTALLQTFTIGGTGGDEEARRQVLALVNACKGWEKRRPK
jgi:hypothetical protein